MKTKILLMLGLCALVTGLAWAVSAHRTIPSYRVTKSQKPISYDAELDAIIAGMQEMARQLPNDALLTRDVIKDCQSLKVLFAESFGKPVGSIDFILQAHEDPLGKIDFAKHGIDPAKSRERIERTLRNEGYASVLVEGSGFDGFSRSAKIQEVVVRIRYMWKGAWYAGFNQRGIAEVAENMVDGAIQNPYGQMAFWTELDKKLPLRFKAGESLPLFVLQGKFISGEITATHRKQIIDSLHRIRSAIAVAKAIQVSKETGDRVAVVFGFLHEEDFRNIASALGIEARIINATGASWETIR